MYLPARRDQYSHDYPAACYQRMEPPSQEVVCGDRLRWWCRGPKIPHLAWQTICLDSATLVESNSHEINSHEVNSHAPVQLPMRSTPTRSTSHEISSMQFLIYKLYTRIWTLSTRYVGHVFYNTLFPHCERPCCLLLLLLDWQQHEVGDCALLCKIAQWSHK